MSSNDCLCRLSVMFLTVTRERPTICIRLENVQRSLTEMYKAFNKISENTFSQLLTKRNNNVNLRAKPELLVLLIHTIKNGQNSLKYYGSIMSSSLSTLIRNSSLLGLFKQNAKD